ncbi:MAG TPA: hypothetical protein VE086_07830, partial [Chthoniobacterales bacterium]|nr:hypothetical protein [Chthoniobacterales bacterium]
MKEFFGLMRGSSWVVRLAISLMFVATASIYGQAAPPEQQQQGPPLVKSVEIQYVGPQTASKDKILAQMRTK